jgi:hypothetical protein
MIFCCTQTYTWLLEVNIYFQLVSELGTLYFRLFLECNLLTSILFIFIMSQNLNSVPPFDGTNYGYWKARMLVRLNHKKRQNYYY